MLASRLQGRGHDPVMLLRESLGHLTNFIHSLSSEEWHFRPAAGWSVPECCEHLLLLEKAVAAQLPTLPENEPLVEKLAAELEDRLVEAVPVAGSKLTAPEPLRPSGQIGTPEAFLAELTRSRNSVLKMAEADPEHWLRVRITHPFFGTMDGRHRLLTLALHLERHLRQMEQVQKQSV